MGLVLLVLDETQPSRGRRNAEALLDALAKQSLDGSVYLTTAETSHSSNGNWSREVQLPASFDVLLLHDNNRDVWDELDREARVILRYTGGWSGRTREKEYWLHRSVTEDQPLSTDEATEILAWFSADMPTALLPPILGGGMVLDTVLEILSVLWMCSIVYSKSSENAAALFLLRDEDLAQHSANASAVLSSFLVARAEGDTHLAQIAKEELHTHWQHRINMLTSRLEATGQPELCGLIADFALHLNDRDDQWLTRLRDLKNTWLSMCAAT